MKHYYFLSFSRVCEKPIFALLVSESTEGFEINEERVTFRGSHIRRICAATAYCFMRQGTYPEPFDVCTCGIHVTFPLHSTPEECAECDKLVAEGVLPF